MMKYSSLEIMKMQVNIISCAVTLFSESSSLFRDLEPDVPQTLNWHLISPITMTKPK